MDPITITLTAAGLAALITAVFFFLGSVAAAVAYAVAITDTQKEIGTLRTQVQGVVSQRETALREAAALSEQLHTQAARMHALEREREREKERSKRDSRLHGRGPKRG